MQFSLEQPIDAPRWRVEEAFTQARFYEALGESPNLAVLEVIDRREEGDTVVLEVRFAFVGALSPTVRTFVDPDTLTWVTTTTVHPAEHWAAFEVVADHHADWFGAGGRYRFDERAAVDGGPTGTLQHMDGEVSVSVPVFGRSAEKGLVSGFAQHLAEQAAVLEAWEG